MITVIAFAAVFKAQVATVPVQKDLNFPPINVTLFPVVRYATLLEALVTTPNATLTVAASTHLHVVDSAFIKTKRELHAHVVVAMPAESEGVSKVIITACPLFENWLDVITGAGTRDLDDSICTESLVLEYCALLDPDTVRTIV